MLTTSKTRSKKQITRGVFLVLPIFPPLNIPSHIEVDTCLSRIMEEIELRNVKLQEAIGPLNDAKKEDLEAKDDFEMPQQIEQTDLTEIINKHFTEEPNIKPVVAFTKLADELDRQQRQRRALEEQKRNREAEALEAKRVWVQERAGVMNEKAALEQKIQSIRKQLEDSSAQSKDKFNQELRAVHLDLLAKEGELKKRDTQFEAAEAQRKELLDKVQNALDERDNIERDQKAKEEEYKKQQSEWARLSEETTARRKEMERKMKALKQQNQEG